MDKLFDFMLFRLNVVDDSSAFVFMGSQIQGDDDISQILEASASAQLDETQENASSVAGST